MRNTAQNNLKLSSTKKKIDKIYSYIKSPTTQFFNVKLFSKEEGKKERSESNLTSEKYLKDLYEWKYKKTKGKGS